MFRGASFRGFRPNAMQSMFNWSGLRSSVPCAPASARIWQQQRLCGTKLKDVPIGHRIDFTSAANQQVAYEPSAKNIAVSKWLFVCCGVVGAVVVIGGITRLTESGLSIVDWKPVTGMIPPLSRAEWEAEFEKYKQFPEYQQKVSMSLGEFQFIFFWEWMHRVLARSLGVVFTGPFLYFLGKRYLTGELAVKLLGCLALGGAQGALGWYMVKSGLDPKLLGDKKATVSQYRLAAHLTLAFTVYSCMLRLALGLRTPAIAFSIFQIWFMARASFSAMFVTAITGAFVAGLDAGLYYNDCFPYMGDGTLLPPAQDALRMEPWQRNLFENPEMVQAIHRLMAGFTTWCIFGLNVAAYRNKRYVSPVLKKAIMGVNHALAAQVILGIATILTYVSIPVAVLHQANSLLLLSMLIRLCAVLGSKGLVL